MKLALAGLFLMLAVMCSGMMQRTHDPWFAVGAGGFALGSIVMSIGVMRGKRQ
jgi:hypothetical protein